MKTSVKKLDNSIVQISITAPDDAIEGAREEAIKRLTKEVKIEGFREGKAPAEKVVEKVGEPVVLREAIEIAVKKLYAAAVEKEKLAVIAPPDVDVESTDPLKFTAKVAVMPEVKIGKWQKIKLEKAEAKLDEKELADTIANIRKKNSESRQVLRAAKKGDRVEIDFAGATPDGVPIDGTTSKNHPIEIGSNSFIPGFEDELVGMEVGVEKKFEIKFPDDYHAKHLAGKPVAFTVKLQKVEEIVEPELNDEFAEKVSGGQQKTWKGVEDDLKKYLQEKAEREANQKLENDFIEKFVPLVEVAIPPVLVERETDFMLRDFQQRLAGGGMKWEDYLKNSGKTEEESRKELAPEAEKRIKIRLGFDKLMEEEKIEITPEEFAAEVEKIKKRYPPEEASKIEAALGEGGEQRARLQHELRVLKMMREITSKLSK